MTPQAMEQAAQILLDAAQGGPRLPALPPACSPATPADALAIQRVLVGRLGGTVAGWKVSTGADGVAMWGAIPSDCCFRSPAAIEARRMPLMGIEGEIAFRFNRDLPIRAEPYGREEIAAALSAFPAVEVVDSRFASYRDAPFLDRLADRMSNGGFVFGAAHAGRTSRDLSKLRVRLSVDGAATLDQVGGHARVDPLLPAIEFVRAVQREQAFLAGQFVTTGTVTGLVFGRQGQRISVEFEEFGRVDLSIA